MTDEPTETIDSDSTFTDKEQEDIVASLTEEDLRQRSQALHDAQETWEEVAYLANPKMPCPECSGAGNVSGGSLGDICVRCLGARVIEQPGARNIDMPPFAQLRAAISAYGDALVDRELPDGHKGKRQLALPAADSVPTLEQIKKLAEDGVAKARQLEGQPGVVEPKLLKERRDGDGELGDHEDAELDAMEAETEEA